MKNATCAASKSGLSPLSISRITPPCGCRCRKRCASKKAAKTQLPGELAAYNPLIPQGDELIATLMLEIEDANRRQCFAVDPGRNAAPNSTTRQQRRSHFLLGTVRDNVPRMHP